jgi:hypothetical protein
MIFIGCAHTPLATDLLDEGWNAAGRSNDLLLDRNRGSDTARRPFGRRID